MRVVSLSILSCFGPRRGRRGVSETAVASMASLRPRHRDGVDATPSWRRQMAPSQRVVPTLDDPESQQPPEDPAIQAEAQRPGAGPSVSFSSSFCASLVVVWAVLLAVSFARDNAPSECGAAPPNITNITRNPACDAPTTNATKAAADEIEPSRFVRMLLDAMDVSCGCMDE